MPMKVEFDTHKNHIERLNAYRDYYSKERGTTKIEGYNVANTTNHDIGQLHGWWHREFLRVLKVKPWHKDPARPIWEAAHERIVASLRDADEDALYPDNHWFWNTALLKLAIYLESQKTTPSPTQLLIESVKETLGERAEDAHDFITGAGKAANRAITAVADAAETVTDAGERALSGLKVAAIVGGSLLGAAIVLPPVIRAFRD